MVFLGIDVGTQGVRAALCSERGELLAEGKTPFARLNEATEPGFREQDPALWWEAVISALSQIDAGRAEVLAIDGTSGTVLPVDSAGRPLMNAIMYNDARSEQQAQEISAIAAEHEQRHGYRFGASFALPKILWIKQHRPGMYSKAAHFLHQSDYIAMKLMGSFPATDYSTALKTGVDLFSEKWPEWFEKIGLDRRHLPPITSPGRVIGRVCESASRLTGLRPGTLICAGASDGTASSIAAGLAAPGDWATIIGTTLVLKGITKAPVSGPAIYSHKHPQGWWLPGGASNVGRIDSRFPAERWGELNAFVDELTPTGLLCYPLSMRGERFPYSAPDMQGVLTDSGDERRDYAAVLEGVGYVERRCYELLSSLGCEVGDVILTAGGACRSAEWLRVRANILNKTLKVPANIDASFGSAVIAASGHFGGLSEAVRAMVHFSATVAPDPEKAAKYDELYIKWKELFG